MKLIPFLLGDRDERRYSMSEWLEDYMAVYSYGGNSYTLPVRQTYGNGPQGEQIADNFAGYVEGVYKRNGVVFACILARLLLFSEARFQWRRWENGRPGDLFGDPSLRLLERPWRNGTTGELLGRMEQDASLAGNFYATVDRGEIRRLRPDWLTIVLGGEDIDPADLRSQDIVGYWYQPPKSKGRSFLPDQIAHYSPIPDPTANYRGMSWLTPVLREITSDGAATDHKQRFFDNGATPNMVVKLDPTISLEAFKAFKAEMDDQHKGALNAYKTLYLGGAADVTVVGSDFRQLDFKNTQGAGETRIAAAAGVPPVIVGLSEGLQAATYSNYAQARRRFADMTVRPLWRMAAASLEPLLQTPTGAELWYDDRDIPALQEDEADAAAILKERMLTVESAVRAGYTPESAAQAVEQNDLRLLKHTGLYSVQLQPPGAENPAPAAKPVDE